MSGSDIVSTLNLLIKLGQEIKTRLDSFNQAAEDLQLMTTSLILLLKVFENPVNEDIIRSNILEFVNILDILQGIAQTCTKCAKALDINLSDTEAASGNTASRGRNFIQRMRVFNKIPDLLAEIKRKAEQLQKVYSAVSVAILNDIREQKEQTSVKETIESTVVVKERIFRENTLEFDFRTDFVNIDQMVGNLLKECEYLHARLQEATLFPDKSAVKEYQTQNPEGASFWKDRFQKDELSASSLRYEALYVSWARFVHEVETSFILQKVPTGRFGTEDIDILRVLGSRYRIDNSGTRCLSTIRPLWLPALQSALDPLHKGYVKPQDYFSLLRDFSLSETLKRLVFESAGYGTLVECERSSADLPFPVAIESPSDHVGWTTAQIVAVPTSDELGIVTERDAIESSSERLIAHFNGTVQNIHVYVRYLQTGQIERKNLFKQVRPVGGICIGAALSIRYELESGGHAWSHDAHITEFKACYGGQYVITASMGSNFIAFSTRPLKSSFDQMLHDDGNSSSSTTLEFECALLGPSRTFNNPPKVGEKIQVEHDGFWYDSKVTVVQGDEIEYTDWNPLPEQIPINDAEPEDEDDDNFFFSEEQLTQLGKGTRRLWRPWLKNLRNSNVRPYRCFHIGDSIEAPVMYPDFRFHYHVTDESQLYLPARIVDIQGDKYVIEFSPALSAHEWWPGRMVKGEEIELVPGSGIKVENPFDFNRLVVSMDQVRPWAARSQPVLGVQSAKPSAWSPFQGVHLHNLEDLLERSLWGEKSS